MMKINYPIFNLKTKQFLGSDHQVNLKSFQSIESPNTQEETVELAGKVNNPIKKKQCL